MAKKVSTVLGVVFIGIGLLGFVWPGFAGAHLSPAHNAIHLASGAAALSFGRGSYAAARRFCLAFGAFYLALGLIGFAVGKPAETAMTMGGKPHHNSHLWALIPGRLELGDNDHVIHIALGSVFIGAGLTRARRRTDEISRRAA